MDATTRTARIAVAAMTLLALAAPAHAQTWKAVFNGTAVAQTGSPGVGQEYLTLTGTSLAVNITFSGLTSPSTASHVHCCTGMPFVGTAAPATQVPSFPGFPLGVTSGTYSQIFDLMLASSYNPAFLAANGGSVDAARAALVAGLSSSTAYGNIHTSSFPSGEIGGYFALTTPEPSSALMLAPGLVTLAGVARKRRPRPSR